MNASSYTEVQRRAANQIWSAAGDYDFEPLFMALHGSQGDPDFYMNLIIGLAYRYYGKELVTSLFDQWNGDVRQNMLDDLTWVYLENALYTAESDRRPSMAELRTDYAEDFFAKEYKLSRQEWMSRNHLVYDIQAARWSSVIGRKKPVLTPAEKKLLIALTPDRMPPGDKLTETLLDIYRSFLLFDGKKKTKKPLKIHFKGEFAHLLTRMMPTQLVKTDRVVVMRSAQGESPQEGFSQSMRSSTLTLKREENDRNYIESCFGRSLYSEKERLTVEKELCTGSHDGCHIWVTDGKAAAGIELSAADRHLIEQSKLQEERNREYFYKNSELHKSIIACLAGQIRNCMLVHQKPDVMAGRSGKLDTARVWRAEYVNDDRIFHSSEDVPDSSFTVDLLLDASASRLQHQEMIAAQGVIISESLTSCRIPVRVSEFCSVRGYTVMRILKSFEDKKSDPVLRYFAAGWNRDGLVMRIADDFLDRAKGPADRHLLIFLTDAGPNDSFRIRPSSENPFGHDYGDETAVRDTASEVRELRRRGLHVSAVFMGTDAAALNAEIIYGKEYARIREIGELAKAAGSLIQKEIREMNV